jgi:hypothetical protein
MLTSRLTSLSNPLCTCFVFIIIISFIAHATSGFTQIDRISHHQSSHQLNNNSMSKNDDAIVTQPIRAGFLGCGTIAYSIASGLANPNHSPYLFEKSLRLESICVTRRSESKSSQLKESYPDIVTVCETAEEVVQNSELVFLCVLPQHVDGVLAELKERGVWKEGVHTLVSLVVRVSFVALAVYFYI